MECKLLYAKTLYLVLIPQVPAWSLVRGQFIQREWTHHAQLGTRRAGHIIYTTRAELRARRLFCVCALTSSTHSFMII